MKTLAAVCGIYQNKPTANFSFIYSVSHVNSYLVYKTGQGSLI